MAGIKPEVKKPKSWSSLKKLEQERIRFIIASLYLKGKPQAVVAEEVTRLMHFRVDVDRVATELKAISKQWQEQALADVGEAKAKELAKIDELERHYWAGWERSLKPAVRTEKKEGLAPSGLGYEEHRTSRAGKEGNPAFLDGVFKCIDRRIKLLGLDAPAKIDITQAIREEASAMGLNPDDVIAEVERIVANR